MFLKKLFFIPFFILASCSNSAISNLSQLPAAPLTAEQKEAITHDCSKLGVDNAAISEAGCALFSFGKSRYQDAIHVNIKNFSGEDLIDRLNVFFEDPSSAPTIIIELNDGVFTGNLNNPGFNIILR